MSAATRDMVLRVLGRLELSDEQQARSRSVIAEELLRAATDPQVEEE